MDRSTLRADHCSETAGKEKHYADFAGPDFLVAELQLCIFSGSIQELLPD
jgi:hypothetical protein